MGSTLHFTHLCFLLGLLTWKFFLNDILRSSKFSSVEGEGAEGLGLYSVKLFQGSPLPTGKP